MALYQQKGSHNWWISIYRGPGVSRLRVSSGTKDKYQAAAIEASLKRAQQRPSEADRIKSAVDEIAGVERKPGVPLSSVLDIYFNLPNVKVAKDTARSRRTDFRRFQRFVQDKFPNVQYMDQVSRDVAFSFMDSLQCQVKGKTYNNIRNNLSAIWSALMYRADLEENVWRVIPNADTSDSEHGIAFTDEEVQAVLNAAWNYGHDWYGVSVIALYTGLRYGDIAFLRWEEIQDDHIKMLPSKTARHSVRVVIPLHHEIKEMLKQRNRNDEYVFPEHKRRYNSNRRWGQFTEILHNAGVSNKGRVTFHSWRHTFRTRLAKAGVPQEIVKKLGGWTSDVAERYNHDVTSLRNAIDTI